jgi:hypothetical protein
MSLTILEGGMRTRYHFLDEDPNGNLILKMIHEIPSTGKYIQEDYTPSFAEAKSVLTPSWSPYQRKTYTWKMEKITENASLYPKEVRANRIGRILLTMFGYTNTSKPTIDSILRKTKNAEYDYYETRSDLASWEHGEYEPRFKNIREDHETNPDKERYISMLKKELSEKSDRKKKSSKAKPKRKVVKKVIKKCKCKK